MKEIKLYKSPQKSLKMLFLSLVFVVPSLYFIIRGEDHLWIWWLSVCFFGIGTVMSLYNMLNRRPRIIINKIGVADRSSDQGIIPWEMIKEAYDITISSQSFICLVVDESFVVKKKLYKWAQKLNDQAGAQKVNLNISLLAADVKKLLTLIDSLLNEPMEGRDMILERYEDRII
jgi:hypothetical protein